MNYYKQGDAAKAEQIKAAFESKGYSDKGFTFDVNDILFFTANNKRINVCPANGWLANIIKTHPDYQELELPVEPKFKVGDKIQRKDSKIYVYTVLSVDLQKQIYLVEHNFKHQILFTNQDNFELVPQKHYDIANFHAGMPVLVRDANDKEWRYVLYSHTTGRYGLMRFNAGSTIWNQCIPFEGNKHLLGTTDMPSEEYINW